MRKDPLVSAIMHTRVVMGRERRFVQNVGQTSQDGIWILRVVSQKVAQLPYAQSEIWMMIAEILRPRSKLNQPPSCLVALSI
jgi:hypothetical protein